MVSSTALSSTREIPQGTAAAAEERQLASIELTPDNSSERFTRTSSVGFFGEVHHTVAKHHGQEIKADDTADLKSERFEPAVATLDWKSVGMIQIGDCVGMGVLTMPRAYAQLGWFLGTILLIYFGFMNIYIGVLLSRAREMIPAGLSYSLMAQHTIRYKWFVKTVEIFFTVYIVSVLGGYVLAQGETLAEIFYGVPLCGPIWSFISICIALIPLQFRTLSEAKPIFWANTFLIFMTIIICTVVILMNMTTYRADHMDTDATHLWPHDLDWKKFFGGVSKILFAYLGAYIYLEIMSEMREPKEFPKAFWISGPFQVIMYIYVGAVGYANSGDGAGDSIVKFIDPHNNSVLMVVTAVALFGHLLASFLIKGNILCRKIHLAVHPETINDKSIKGRLIWFAITCGLIVMCYIISNAIPIFGSLTSLLGAIFSPTLGFMVPIILFVYACKVHKKTITLWEKIWLAVIFITAFVVLCAGTVADFMSLIDAIKNSSSKPFQCVKESYLDEYH